MKQLIDLTDDEIQFRQLHETIKLMAAQRDKLRTTLAQNNLDLKNLNSVITGMNEEIEALREKKVELIKVEEDDSGKGTDTPPA